MGEFVRTNIIREMIEHAAQHFQSSSSRPFLDYVHDQLLRIDLSIGKLISMSRKFEHKPGRAGILIPNLSEPQFHTWDVDTPPQIPVIVMDKIDLDMHLRGVLLTGLMRELVEARERIVHKLEHVPISNLDFTHTQYGTKILRVHHLMSDTVGNLLHHIVRSIHDLNQVIARFPKGEYHLSSRGDEIEPAQLRAK